MGKALLRLGDSLLPALGARPGRGLAFVLQHRRMGADGMTDEDVRWPCSTYRLQLRSGVTLRDAIAAVDYLHTLGITHLYLSPIAKARRDSTHGYDVCDPNVLDPALGTPDDLDELARALHARDMGLLLDIVPNHLAADERDNAWWRDVLTRGAESPAANIFDIDWHSARPSMDGKVLLPILGEPYGAVLERGELRVERADDAWVLRYGERELPLNVPADADLSAINGEAGTPASFDRLHALLERQSYRLADWRTAPEQVNYRRFFNIEHLVGVRVDESAVFAATHDWIGWLVRHGVTDGLRVDHPDGLSLPADYLHRLHRLAAGDLNDELIPSSLYVVVEKILLGHETVPDTWPVQGTTGYEFLNALNGIFIARHRMRRLERIYARFAGRRPAFAETEYAARKQVIETTFTSDLDRLVDMLGAIAESDRRTRDLTPHRLRRGLIEVTAALPVYRTYAGAAGITPGDRARLGDAVRKADRRSPDVESALFAFIEDTIARAPEDPARLAFTLRWQQLTGPVFAKAVEDTAFYRDNLLLSLNEVGGDPSHPGTGVADFHAANQARAVRAPRGLLATTTHDTKLSEDVRARLNALSELDEEWHAQLARWRRWNQRHRTRTSEGAVPDRHDEYRFYQLLIGLWPADAETPSASLVERLVATMIKSAREARRHTSWVRPDAGYEDGVTAFVRRTLDPARSARFVAAVASFARAIAAAGMINSLAQVVLKVGSPGVPDFYQGTELWSLRLTDPDNRAVVDLDYRARMLEAIDAGLGAADADRPAIVRRLLESWLDGAIKMYVTTLALRERRGRPELFTTAEYASPAIALDPPGAGDRPHVVAILRRTPAAAALVVAPRFSSRLASRGQWPMGEAVWAASTIEMPDDLADGTFVDIFTGARITAEHGRVRVADVLRGCPVALAVHDAATAT
jgi:(1->4)-alpha-D-glucan 1-alpha-D-glucosylmutase